MATNILNIGKSALNAAQIGINVTGNNIANAATPGYSRQVAQQTTAGAQNFGYGYIGQGTQVASITRIYNQIVAAQVNQAQTSSSATNAYAAQMEQIDNMLGDGSAGLSPAIQQFFSSVQTFASNPASAASRQAVLASAQSLTNRFQSIGNRLDEIRAGVNAQLVSSTALATSYAQQIAQLNDAIGKALSINSSNPPNDLMDQRDLSVTELNKLIKTDVSVQDDGSYNVTIGNGVPLVVGGQAFGLSTTPSALDPSQLDIAYQTNVTTPLGAGSLSGGVIGGLVQFRDNSLNSIQNQIGQIATVMADTLNAQNRAGFDSNGTAGGNIFNVPSPQSYGASGNSSGASLSVSLSDSGALTSSDYRIAYDGTNFNITRLSDGLVQSYTSLPQTVDGLAISGTLAAGDSFTIQPTRNGAVGLAMAMSDGSLLAASDAAGGSGNNANALLLAGLQTKASINNQKLTYEGAFGQLVSSVGVQTNALKVNGAAETALLASATATQQSESGVNLDEEATNLLRYQQAYQAAGKVMQVATALFDTLLSIGN